MIIDYKIVSNRTDERYLKRVQETMDLLIPYLIQELSNSPNGSVLDNFKRILEDLPFNLEISELSDNKAILRYNNRVNTNTDIEIINLVSSWRDMQLTRIL